MRNKEKILKLLFVILFVLIILYLITFIEDIADKNKSYFLLDPYNIYEINNGNVKTYKGSYKKLNNSEAKLYKNGKEIEGYFKVNDNQNIGYTISRFYDKGLNEQSISDGILIIGNEKINDYTQYLNEKFTSSDVTIINKYLKENSLNTLNDLSKISIAKLQNETIYQVRMISLTQNKEDSYVIIFSYKNGVYETIYLKEGENLFKRNSKLNKLVDINNDNKIDLILESAPYISDDDNCYSLYINENGTYKPIINCEEE